jgi:hypothetical protein
VVAGIGPQRYRIFIGGGLSTAIREAFEGFTIISDGAYTTLIADLDQAAPVRGAASDPGT